MTTELWGILITAVVALLGSITAFIKSRMTDSAREETKVARDRAEVEIRDMCRQNSWEVSRLKEDLAMARTTLDDHQLQLTAITTELAKVSTKLDTALEILRYIKDGGQ
jgi:predicted  nucleic acid-binding Zn-ribbon protein